MRNMADDLLSRDLNDPVFRPLVRRFTGEWEILDHPDAQYRSKSGGDPFHRRYTRTFAG